MRRLTIALLFLAIGGPSMAADLVITSVNVVSTADGSVAANRDVIITDGLITQIVESGASPQATESVDGAGAWLIPGLAEMHAHVPPHSDGERTVQDVLLLYLANGITTVRGMLGEEWHVTLREALEDQAGWIGPSLVTSGPSLNGQSVTSAEQAAEEVRRQHAAGYDFLKLHPGLEADEFDAIATTANELGMPFAGHVSVAVGLDATLQHRQATIDHLDGYANALVPRDSPGHEEPPQFFGVNLANTMDGDLTAAAAMATALAGVWNVPTQSLLENLAGDRPLADMLGRPEMVFVSDTRRDNWIKAVNDFRGQVPEAVRLKFLQVRRRLIRELQDARAGLLLGSDAPQIMNVPGFSIHEEIEFLVLAGLTPLQALQSGTTSVATFLGRPDSGQVRAGYAADLVLLGANPLDDVTATRAIRGVVRAGKWYDRATLNEWLEGIRERKL